MPDELMVTLKADDLECLLDLIFEIATVHGCPIEADKFDALEAACTALGLTWRDDRGAVAE